MLPKEEKMPDAKAVKIRQSSHGLGIMMVPSPVRTAPSCLSMEPSPTIPTLLHTQHRAYSILYMSELEQSGSDGPSERKPELNKVKEGGGIAAQGKGRRSRRKSVPAICSLF